MSQATRYNPDDHDATGKRLEYENLHGVRITADDTAYRIRPESGWQEMEPSGMQICNAWRYGGEQADEPVEKLLVLAADATDKQTHFDGYGVEHFRTRPGQDGYDRTFRSYTDEAALAEALDAYGFAVETDSVVEEAVTPLPGTEQT